MTPQEILEKTLNNEIDIIEYCQIAKPGKASGSEPLTRRSESYSGNQHTVAKLETR